MWVKNHTPRNLGRAQITNHRPSMIPKDPAAEAGNLITDTEEISVKGLQIQTTPSLALTLERGPTV